jgi:hypothetical protein
LARDLLAALGPDMLVLCDRNFLSHTLARDVLATGAHILWRASASFTLTPIRVLSDGTYCWPPFPVTTAWPWGASPGERQAARSVRWRCRSCATTT